MGLYRSVWRVCYRTGEGKDLDAANANATALENGNPNTIDPDATGSGGYSTRPDPWPAEESGEEV